MTKQAIEAGQDTQQKKTGKKNRATVFVLTEVCKGCSFCVDFCPPLCLEFSREYNAKGYSYPILARPEDCTGCDLCGLYCPDFAIYAVKYKALEKLITGN